jgi:thiamine kinase-like enzyme
MYPKVGKIIDRIPGWKDAQDFQVEPLAGLTNTNYAVTVHGERFVLRVSGSNAARLGVNRELEREILLAASKAGIGPQVAHFLLPEGHLVTRYIDGQHLAVEAYCTRENIQRIVERVKYLHSLPPIRAIFSPFRRVEKFASQARTMQVPFPSDFENMMQKMAAIEREQAHDTDPWQGFCHNDLFCVNVLDDGNIHFIDWEFAGMGDIYFDLATLTYAYDSPDTLSPELQTHLLACYFDEVKAKHWDRLEGMKFMLMFFSAMWGLLQQGLQNEGLVRKVEGFNFLEYANTTFESMRNSL